MSVCGVVIAAVAVDAVAVASVRMCLYVCVW